MATWADVRRHAMALPEVTERTGRDGLLQWRIRDKAMIVWERPLRASDLRVLGAAAPQGPILGARVPDEGVKFALIAEDPGVYFTTPHFDGYPAVLVRLDAIAPDELEELVEQAWLDRAPRRLAASYLQARGGEGRDTGGAPAAIDRDSAAELPLPAIGSPATRALAAAGITTLHDVAGRTEAQLLALHGVGPRAVEILRESLHRHGMSLQP